MARLEKRLEKLESVTKTPDIESPVAIIAHGESHEDAIHRHVAKHGVHPRIIVPAKRPIQDDPAS